MLQNNMHFKWILRIIIVFLVCMSHVYAATRLCYQFNDIDQPALTNIKALLKLDKHNCRFTASPRQAYRLYKQTPSEIRKAIQPFGYFKPNIQSRLIFKNHDALAKFCIEPGPILKISELNINISGEGSDNKAINKFIRHFPIKAGDNFNTVIYDAAKSKLYKIARNQGYIKSFFQNKILINLRRYTAQIKILLYTGERYYFGPIAFKTHIYAESFMRRIFKFEGNQPFSSMKLNHVQQDMEQSYYFKDVIITPDFESLRNQHVPVAVEYTVPKAQRYSLGLGYGTLTGPRLTAGLSLRRLTDTGHHFEADLKLSSVISALTANYYIPGNNPLTDEWLIGANAKYFQPNAGRSTSATLTGGYSTKSKRIKTNIDLNLLFERYRIFPDPYRKSHELYPSFYIAYLDADNLITPKNGIWLAFQLKAATDNILSTTSFVQPQVMGKLVYSPFSFAKFIFRGNLGATAVHHLINYPLSLRFFAGGMNSIRGFADSSIGPGRYLMIGSAEYQNKLVGDLNGAIFYDAGTATNHFATPINRGAGIGLIYNTILGPIKIYAATALSKKTHPKSIEFSVGPEFS